MEDLVRSQYFNETHALIRNTVRRFVEKEILPFVEEWEEAGSFPRELYQKAGSLGILGINYPEEYGGSGRDLFAKIAQVEELMECGSAGIVAGLGSLDIALPPILALGTEEQKQLYIPRVLKGVMIAALGITEPDAGSDVANIRTRAVRKGDNYAVNGSKTFITSGCRADLLTTLVRTGKEGHKGLSLLIIESNFPGYSVSKPLKKMGWWASDTCQIFFEDCLVPAKNLLGREGEGFYGVMRNFQTERLHLSVMAYSTARLALRESVKYVKEREVFGRRLSQFQVTRHKIADMATLVEVSREFTYSVAKRMEEGLDQTKEISMAKNFATQVAERVTYQAVQLHGGYGYMRGYLVERLYRDARILSIGGGTQEIMKEIISRYVLGE